MSTIMKALDRLERLDKKRATENRERPLREEVAERHTLPPPSRRVGRALWIGAATAGALLSVGAMFFYSGVRLETPGERPHELAVSPPPVASAPQSRIVSVERRITQSNTSPNVLIANTQETQESRPITLIFEEPSGGGIQFWVDEVHELSPAALTSDVAVIELTTRVEPKVVIPPAPKRMTGPSGLSDAAPRRTAPTLPESKTAAPEPKTIVRVAPPSIATQKSPREAPASLRPEFENESPAVSAAPVPALRDVRVARTIWHPTPGRRHAYVEVSGLAGPLRVREGDLVGHLSVKKIEPWGVVFLEDGIEIQYRVGADD